MRTHNFYRPAPRTTIIDNSITMNSTTINNGTGLFGYGLCGTTYSSCCGWNWSGCDCSGGGFWGGFRNGLGMVLGGFLGGIGMNLLGGLGFGGMMSPWGMSSWGMTSPWSLWGGRGGSAAGAAGSSKAKDTCENKDEKTFNKLWDEFVTIQKTPDRAKAHDLYKRVLEKIETPEDDTHKAQDIKNYEKIKGALDRLAETEKWGDLSEEKAPVDKKKPVENKEPEEKVQSDDNKQKTESTTWNEYVKPTIPENVNVKVGGKTYNQFASADDFKTSGKCKLLVTHDKGTNTRDVVARTNTTGVESTISNELKDGFPIDLSITDKDTGKTYKYHLAKVENGKAIYNTPTADGNNNHYVLVKDKDNNLMLYQDDGFNGYNKKDEQN